MAESLLPHWSREELEKYRIASELALEWGMAEKKANSQRFRAMRPYIQAIRLCGEVLKEFNDKAKARRKLLKLNEALKELGIDREAKLDVSEIEDLKEEIRKSMRNDPDYKEALDAWRLGRNTREYFEVHCIFMLQEKGDWQPKTYEDILNMPQSLEEAVREYEKRRKEVWERIEERSEKKIEALPPHEEEGEKEEQAQEGEKEEEKKE